MAYDKLDLGGRIRAPEGFMTLDLRPPADFVVDLEHPPESFPTFKEMRAHDVLEHIRDLCTLMDWIWEHLEPGGFIDIMVPHKDHGCAWHDPTHVRYFTELTFDYFTERLAYFGYVRHHWEYKVPPHRTGPHDDYVAVTLQRPL